MRRFLFSTLVVCVILIPWVSAQEAPVNYGPEWESIKQSYQQITDNFSQKRMQILNDTSLSGAQQNQRIALEYDQLMGKSRQLAARRSEIIKIAAQRSGLSYTLGSDPAQGRGMAGDIDLGGTPQQARQFLQELKNLGIADAFDEVGSIQRKPGYVSLKVPMDVTVNFEGPLGQVGSSAYETQVAIDARSKETYLSVAMKEGQPGVLPVQTLDDLNKATQGLKTPPSQMLNTPEALQVACKGTFKAVEGMRVSDPELRAILRKSGLNMTPDQFLNTLDQIRKGNNIAPELAGVNESNVKNLCQALDETNRVCRTKAMQAFDIEIRRARGLESTLLQSTDPAIRSQIPEVRAQIIDSTTRMRENLNALIEMDQAGAGVAHADDMKVHNERLKLWMQSIESGTPRKPIGPTVYGEVAQFRLPGADMVDDLVTRGIKGYQNFRNNARINELAGAGMQYAGGAMIGVSWYASSKADGDSDWAAAAKGVGAGLASLTRLGSLALGASDIRYHMTVKAEKYGHDQELYYALMGLDTKKEGVQDLINTKVLVRKGVYGAVKATSYSSIFLAHPALIVTGAALEASLAVYEAYEEADLWERYADQLEQANDAMDQYNMQRGAWVAQQVVQQLASQAEALTKAVASYHELIKERDPVAKMHRDFAGPNGAYQAYLEGLVTQVETLEAPRPLDAGQAQATLTTLKQVQGQADQCAGQVVQAASALQQNPESLGSAQSVLQAMTSEYQALTLQLDMVRPIVTQLTVQGQVKPEESPAASLAAYQKQMAELEAMLKPRYEAVNSLLNNSDEIFDQIDSLQKRRTEYLERFTRYAGYLSRQSGPAAAEALTAIQKAQAALQAVKVPLWKTDFALQLGGHYIHLRDMLEQVQASARLVNRLYPEPLGSLYRNIQPQTVALSPQIGQQWSRCGTAMGRFHSALAVLRGLVAAIVPEEDTPESETETDYAEWDPTELRNELARLRALKAELSRRCDASIADLNKAYFGDRDALWKAYEAAFKTPKMLACDNCKTETMHSMDYSENPPSVWCNSCGRMLSFMAWAGEGGDSLEKIRTRGQAKKAEIQSQLASNLHAVDMAIDQVNEALRGR
jgi:hypothetical protein